MYFSSVAVWSGVNIAGVRLRDINAELGSDGDKEHWEDLHRQVVQRSVFMSNVEYNNM